jgi:pyruvate kinase
MAHEGHHAPEDIPLDFPEDFRGFAPGMEVFADDGNISLEVVTVSPGKLKLRVTQGGVLKPRKGVNIPELKLRANIMTEKDRADITFGLEHRVDFVAQSFVRNRNDIMRVEKIVRAGNPDCRAYAKIENHEGVRNLAAIIESCDGILIARGDLGVSLPIYKLPVIQKSVIRQCNKRKKYSVTATQMLESMTENKRPTRAEVSDVANAILDGSDYVMLSGETAAGRFPVESVKMMRQIIEYTEASIRLKV